MAFRPVHTAEESAGTLRPRAVQAVVAEDFVAGVSAARTAGIKCFGSAPARWLAEPARAGAGDRVSELPPDGTGYLGGFLTARGGKPAGGAEK